MTTVLTQLDVRADFPFLSRTINGQPLAYLDNAATTQKPRVVLDTIQSLYSSGIANVHRAGNFLAHDVTERFEGSRRTIASFIGAEPQEVIFVANATHGLNLACAGTSGSERLRVLTSTLEHHSNLLPWHARTDVEFVSWSRTGELDLDSLDDRLRARPHLLAVTYASNFLGTLQPLTRIIEAAHHWGVRVLVDASQAIAHVPIDVRQLDCDYLVFSGHKIYGPGGTGVLYARSDRMEELTPLFLGGGMVKEVHEDGYALNDIPLRFEAGTPNIEGVLGLAAAMRYLSSIGYQSILAHERQLTDYTRTELAAIPRVELFGPGAKQPTAPVVSFHIRGLESSAVEKVLAGRGNVILRAGFHCAQPAHDALGIGPTIRASFGIYNSIDEIDRMLEILSTLTRHLE